MFWFLLVSAGFLYLLYTWITMKPKNFPPGPPYFPIIGSFPFVPTTYLHFAMEKWRHQYGPVVGLLMGNKPTIAVCDPTTVLEVLKREEFQGRTVNELIKERNFNKRLGLMFNDGPAWVEQRRFILRILKDFGFGKTSMETFTHEEIEELSQELKNKTMQVKGLFNVSIVNLLWSVMAGIRYKHDDPELKVLLNQIEGFFRNNSITATNLATLFPFLKYIAPNFVEDSTKVFKDLQVYFRKVILEHEQVLDENNPKDFIDVYLSEIHKQPTEYSSFSVESLIVICLDLFLAGAESVGNSLAFSLLYMVLYPEVQEKVHKELDKHLGQTQMPTLSDRKKLSYIDAVLMEIQRHNSIAPLAIPHTATRDTQLNGYFVPKGTDVFLSIWTLLQDKDHWEDTLSFRPERFLDNSGNVLKNEWFIPFGTGKRQCTGEVFARNNLFLFFTSLLQKFTITLPQGHPKPPIMSQPGITTAPQPFEVTFTPR